MTSYGSPPINPKQPDPPAAMPDAPAVDLPTLDDMLELYETAAEAAVENNKLCRRDRDYKDGKQWSDEDLAALALRNQPAIVKNRIAKKVNFVLGEEIAKRIDPVAKPRTPKHEDDSRAMTDALRYIADEQKFNQVRSAVFHDMLVYGMGGAVKTYNAETGKHELTHVEWDRIVRDPHSRKLDASDALHLDIVVWYDLADAIADFPDSANDVRAAVGNESVGNPDSTTDDTPRTWIDRKRKRVKVVEHYQRVGANWYVATFTKGALLKKPERTDIMDERGEHSVCSFKVALCYIDQEGNPYGIVRGLISGQDELNKRASKALHLLSVNRVIAERDVIRHPQKFQQELAKPDGYNEVEPGALVEGRIKVDTGIELAAAHVSLMEQAKQDLDTIGPSASMLPGAPATSGREVLARSRAASQELGSAFDSLRNWTLSIVELDWLCARQNWTDEKWIRVTDDNETAGYRFVGLNRPMTRAARLQELLAKPQPPPLPKALDFAANEDGRVVLQQVEQIAKIQSQGMPPQDPKQAEQQLVALIMQHPLMQLQTIANHVAEIDIDIVLDEAPDTAILAEEQFETLTKLAPTIVQARQDMAPKIARMILQSSSLPNKRELLNEWDKPPDQHAQQLQQAQQALAIEELKQQVALLAAQVQKTQADAQLSAAKAQSEAAGAMPQAPEPPKPHEIAALHREQVGTQTDIAKAQAQIEKDRALTQKHHVDTSINIAKAQRDAMRPGPGQGAPPDGPR